MSTNEIPSNLWEILSSELSESRRQKIIDVASARTQHITLVLQDVSSEHNICACLRSAEAFGVQNVHIVNEKKNYRISTVAKGSSSWLTIHNHRNIEECVNVLKQEGYTLCAAVPKQNSVTLEKIDSSKPLALVFGNEHAGISDEWEKHVDLFFTIPMCGFVESLNISVSAAISLQWVTQSAQKILEKKSYSLSERKRTKLLNHWALKKIPHALKKYARLTI